MTGLTEGTVKNYLCILHKIAKAKNTCKLLEALYKKKYINVDEYPAPVYLPERGKEVLELLRHGNTRTQIAQTLGISMSGVKKHCERLVEKNGCASLYELIARYNVSCILQKENEETENRQNSSENVEKS